MTNLYESSQRNFAGEVRPLKPRELSSNLTRTSKLARSYSGYYRGLSIRRREFDSPTSRQIYSARASKVYAPDC